MDGEREKKDKMAGLLDEMSESLRWKTGQWGKKKMDG